MATSTSDGPASKSDRQPYSTWLLESLFTGKHRGLHGVASRLLGLLGLVAFALLTTAATFGLYVWTIDEGRSSEAQLALLLTVIPLGVALTYSSVLVTLQWVASCQAFVTARLAVIFAFVLLFLEIISVNSHSIQGIHVLMFAPFSAFGFIQHRRGWKALAWGQTLSPPRPLGISNVMDITAAIALTMAMTQTAEFRVAGLACLLPASLLMMIVGAHGWARLQTMCCEKADRDTGLAIWHSGNGFLAIMLFIMIASSYRRHPTGLLGLLVVPVIVLSMHLWTAIALRWLRWCGWRLERYKKVAAVEHMQSPTLPDGLLNF